MKENYILFYQLANRGCNTLLNLLNKAQSFVAEKGISAEEILDARLAPDMFNFTRQVQIYTDVIVGVVYRLTGQEKPSIPDTEKTIGELIVRVNSVKEMLAKINPRNVDEKEMSERKISLPWMKGMYFEAGEYLQNYAFLNTIFHLTTAYDILRMKGLQIGKMDFLGKLEMKS
jgi:hypothetical protein